MYMTRALSLLLVLQCCELCVTIKVPTKWDNYGKSEVIENEENKNREDAVKPNKPLNVQKPIPIEYFEYNAPKPQFAVEVAKFHGVQNPEGHYKAYPIRPYEKASKPQLGIHQILNEDKIIYQPYQRYVNNNEGHQRHVQPVSTGYEIFHPYKAEEPALKQIYKDPVLAKIRNDLEDSKSRLQVYESEAGRPHITKEEYLENPDDIDRKLFPIKNDPAPYEIHRPERRPVYYRAPIIPNPREKKLNNKFRHAQNQNYVKIRPAHYQPLKNHLQQFRQHQASKYDDERNEYPQTHTVEHYAEPDDGYDIYERGKEKYTKLQNNVDESINKAVPLGYQKLELQNNEPKNDDDSEDDEEEFVPVKNYAQVRKTEVVKHLPRTAAFDDAETLEEIINAPRLREAIKSAKAQTVYTEEGYEDAAYDHAGEHKQASDHEGHGGYLKEKQISAGLYKIPSEKESHEDDSGSEHGGKILHKEKWKNDNKNHEEEIEDDTFSEVENEQSDKIFRNKREHEYNIKENEDNDSPNVETQHDVDKREIPFEVPDINVTATFLSDAEIRKIAQQKLAPVKDDSIKEKYPYYFKKFNSIHENSPLRYAENLTSIPLKSRGGTEFYDSRSKLECSEVENVDPVPKKLKNGENPTEDSSSEHDESEEKKFETMNKQPRLKGLGDKIDCFKTKYFGENPLDSPFFKEEIISNPEPVIVPNLATFQLKHSNKRVVPINSTDDTLEQVNSNTDIFMILDKLRKEQNTKLQESINKTKEKIASLPFDEIKTFEDLRKKQAIVNGTENLVQNSTQVLDKSAVENILTSSERTGNIDYKSYQNKIDVTKRTPKLRKKRGTPFVYEPYKIIRDGQVQDSKKTTTTSNISPLIKQLQSSRVVDRVTKANKENDKQVKRNTNTRTYKNIRKKDREPTSVKDNKQETTIIDVSVDPRRGEPRYEIRPSNHKAEYTPVENRKSMTLDDYKSHTTDDTNDESLTTKDKSTTVRSRQRKTTMQPYYDVSHFIPKVTEIQSVAASNTVKKTVTTPSPKVRSKKRLNTKNNSEEREYEDNDNGETTTTTPKPSFRRRIKSTTTTETPSTSTETEEPKLKLVTRFRNYKPAETPTMMVDMTEPPSVNKYKKEYDITAPKYREKKKKTSTSTLVTDTKKYGEDDEDDEDDRRREEVDALIGVQENLDDYIPLYEKEEKNKRLKLEQSSEDDEEDSSESEDDDDESDEYDSDEDDNEDEEDENEEEDEDEEADVAITTPEPTKRSLVRTTDAPVPTIASRSAKITEAKPIVTKKKIEIHKETPFNKSSPHVSQFKEDIEEVEIIKEIPTISNKMPQNNLEALELYKDDSLAEDINKLGDVEIFSEDIDLEKGPKHGGNYRAATKEELKELVEGTKAPKDAVASQSENKKHVEIDEYVPKRMHGGNLKSLSDIQRSRNSGRNSKLVELNDSPLRGMHGGNLRYGNNNRGRRGGRKSEKLIELDETPENKRNNPKPRDENFKSFNPRHERLHGGNYRSAKLVQASEIKEDSGKNGRKNSAELLNSFAQAVPVLTTTPGYILDPSKRMYYYVDS